MSSSSADEVPVLAHRHVFGLKADVKSNVHFGDDNVVIFPSGNLVVQYHMDSNLQRFMHGSDVNDKRHEKAEITCIALSPNKKFLAFAERGQESASIVVYDTRTNKKRKQFSTTELICKEYTFLSFSADSKNILSLGGAPDTPLINWQWQRNRPAQMLKLDAREHLSECSFCPSDPNLVCITGRHALLFYKIDNVANAFKPVEVSMYDREPEDYTTHTWLKDTTMVIGTSKGNLLIMDNSMFQCVLPTSPANGKMITAVIPYLNDGFLVGGEGGVIRLYQLQDVKENVKLVGAEPIDAKYNYVLKKTFTIEQHQDRIRSLAVDPMGEKLVATTETGQMLTLNDLNSNQSELVRPEDAKFEYTISSFHEGPVTGMDVCVRKPLVVTCGLDMTVRVWNYQDKKLEQMTRFNEPAYSVSFHPSGLHVIIGFVDKLKLCNILYDDIKPYKELPIKQCIEVQYSNGGHLFAVAENVGIVKVFDTYTGECVHTIRGHMQAIKSLYWQLDDSAIISAGLDGAVYERRFEATNTKSPEYVRKGCKFSSALCTEDGKIYAVGDDHVLQEILGKGLNVSMDCNVILTQIVVSHPPQRMMFAGTINGVVRSLQFPLTGDVKDYQCHSKQITRLRISADDGFLFTCSDDGMVAIFNIEERDGKLSKRDRPDAVAYSEEILVKVSDLEEKNGLMQELENKLEEMKDTKEYTLRSRDAYYQEEIKQLTEKFSLQLEHDRSKIQMKRDEKQELEQDLEEKYRLQLQRNANTIHLLDQDYQKQVMKEMQKYQQLQEHMEKTRQEYEKEVMRANREHLEEMTRRQGKYESDLENEKSLRKEKESELEENNKLWAYTKEQLEEDYDKEIELLKEKYESKLHQERDNTLHLKGENGMINKKFFALHKDIDEQKEAEAQMRKTEEEKMSYIDQLKKRIQDCKLQNQERDSQIFEKEKQIYDLKKDNQELEKFKFVLDYQIRELKRQIEPRETEINGMRDTIASLDKSLEEYHRNNGKLSEDVITLQTDLKRKQKVILRHRARFRQSVRALQAMGADMYSVVQLIQDPPKLRQNVKKLHQQYMIKSTQGARIDQELAKEYKRQKQYLEKSVRVLKRKLLRDMKARRNDNMRIMQENVALIKEINQMRREIKMMYQLQRQKEMLNPSETSGEAGDKQGEEEEDKWDEKEARKVLEMQRQQLKQLRFAIDKRQAEFVSRAVQEDPVANAAAGGNGGDNSSSYPSNRDL